MNSWLSFLLLSTLCLTVFLLFYYMFLRKDTYYTGNRFYLLFTGLVSLLIPFFKNLLPLNGYSKQISIVLSPVLITGDGQTVTQGLSLSDYLLIVYFSAAALLLVNFLWKIIRLLIIIINSESVEKSGVKIVLLESCDSPYSFLNRVFMTNEQMNSEQFQKIIAHEKNHINRFHTADLIFTELIKILNWFNPLAWILKKEIEAQHEFEADSSLLSSGVNANEYKNVLIAYSFGAGSEIVTNNFNSLLTRRFEMLSRKKSGSFGKVKFLFTLPLLLALLILTSAVNNSASFAQDKKGGKVLKLAEKMPEFPGGPKGLTEFFIQNVKYPQEAKDKGIQGKVFVQFIVNEDGSLSNVKVQKGFNKDCDQEALRVVNLMPKWEPGKDKGKPVKVAVVVPIAFALK